MILFAVGAYFFKVAICKAPHIADVCDVMPDKTTAWYRNYDYIMDNIKALNAHSRQEIVSVKSYDGLTLKGRLYLTSDNPEKFIIFFHGWHSTGFNDGAVITRYYVDKGYNVLLVDQRARGMSEGKYTCFGIKERYDVLSWANYLNERFGKNKIRLILEGISMGASSVMMATSLDLPDNVVGLLVDCGFTSPYEQFKHIITNSMHLPEFPLLNIFSLYCKIFAKFDIKACDTREHLAKWTKPIAMIHGGRDNFVPTDMSRQNLEVAAGEKELLIIPEASHGVAFLHDKETVLRFLDQYLERTL